MIRISIKYTFYEMINIDTKIVSMNFLANRKGYAENN